MQNTQITTSTFNNQLPLDQISDKEAGGGTKAFGGIFGVAAIGISIAAFVGLMIAFDMTLNNPDAFSGFDVAYGPGTSTQVIDFIQGIAIAKIVVLSGLVLGGVIRTTVVVLSQ